MGCSTNRGFPNSSVVNDAHLPILFLAAWRWPHGGHSWWNSAGCPVVQFSPHAEPGRLPLRHFKIQNDASGCMNACQKLSSLTKDLD
jgi:hypothetical protein